MDTFSLSFSLWKRTKKLVALQMNYRQRLLRLLRLLYHECLLISQVQSVIILFFQSNSFWFPFAPISNRLLPISPQRRLYRYIIYWNYDHHNTFFVIIVLIIQPTPFENVKIYFITFEVVYGILSEPNSLGSILQATSSLNI
jgi:hypothetical protein